MIRPPWVREWLRLDPTEFERLVVHFLNGLGQPLKKLEVRHQPTVSTPDGEFDLDALASFEALGLDFVVVVECKHHKNPIKRELVQVLADKVAAIRAHKGVMFSTAPFQSGAIEFAQARRIGLVHFTEGGPIYETKALEEPDVPNRPYDAYAVSVGDSGGQLYRSDVRAALRELLFLP